MTEDEARTKVCTHLPVDVVQESLNDDAVGIRVHHYAKCLASGCMMWRWLNQEYSRDTELWSKSKNKRVTSAHSDDADWRPIGPLSEPPPGAGYCGLAGPKG